ncbi:site-specific tyrosine recombinase XerC [compost metagenome]
MKLKLPKKPYKGIKIYCNLCKKDNPSCKHFDRHTYRMRLHVPGTKNSTKVRVLESRDYDGAVEEAIEFKREMIACNYVSAIVTPEGNDYSLADAILKYLQYLDGEHEYAHLKKEVSKGHKDECVRFCELFANNVKEVKDIFKMRVIDTSQNDVARFYLWAEKHYAAKTFNKCMAALKAFYQFLIDVEGLEMKNPFRTYVAKHVIVDDIETLTQDEFNGIIDAIEKCSPYMVLKTGNRKTMHQPYLKDAFKLFLLTGGRREEIVDLKWSDIYTSVQGVKFFKIANLKVKRSSKGKSNNKIPFKYLPINSDLFDFLKEQGYEKNKNTNNYILHPDRQVTSKTIMDNLSKAFTHYRIEAGIKKSISFNNLRKTYLTWVRAVMQKDTGVLSSHATEAVIEKHYIDPKILSVIEKGALEIKVFGT